MRLNTRDIEVIPHQFFYFSKKSNPKQLSRNVFVPDFFEIKKSSEGECPIKVLYPTHGVEKSHLTTTAKVRASNAFVKTPP